MDWIISMIKNSMIMGEYTVCMLGKGWSQDWMKIKC